MTICAVIDNKTNQQVNLIVAEVTDLPPEGCRLVEIPDGFYWNGTDVVEVVNGN
jgi:hypothetical protein